MTHFAVTVSGLSAEHLADSLRKGDRVIVVGRLEQHADTLSGYNHRPTYDLIAEEIGASVRYEAVTVRHAGGDSTHK